MKRLIILPCLLFSALPASAQKINHLGAGGITDASKTFSTRASMAPSASYKLDRTSYDPLIVPPMRMPAGERLHIIGGTINIPGIYSDLNFARQYRQSSYMRHDLQSDVALTVYTKNIPKVIMQVLTGVIENKGDAAGGTHSGANQIVQDEPAKIPTESDINALNIPQDEKDRLIVELHNAQVQIEGRENPYRKNEMLKMYTQIMAEESALGLEPDYGQPHEWSPAFRQYCVDHGEVIPLTFSKMLAALASGVTSRHFRSNLEEQLIKYILEQKDGSVTLDQIFRQSYRISRGDVYLTILTIENILSDQWRNPQRDKLAVTKKLSNICNFYGGRGDKYGAWYHLHGIMLYGYVRGGFRAAVVGGIESMGSHVLDGGNEAQEDFTNSVGGKIGAGLAKIVKGKKYMGFKPDRNYCDPAVYLNLNEDFRDRLEYVFSKEVQMRLTRNGAWLRSVNRDLENCHVEIIYNDATGKLNSKYIAKRDNVTIKVKRSTLVSLKPTSAGLREARAFISNCTTIQRGVMPSKFWLDAEPLPAD